jgi:hypothetical protein
MINAIPFQSPGSTSAAIAPCSLDEKVDNFFVEVDKVNPSEVDALLAKELNQLSLNELERAYEEIHGVHGGKLIPGGKITAPSAEEERKIREALTQMVVELENITEKAAYDEAVAMKSPMVNDIEFQTKFIYAENFDPPKAAKRLVNYLEFARQHFGVQALHRSVQWADLSPNALEIMNRGEIQNPSFRDQAHRRICILLREVGLSYPLKDRVSAITEVLVSMQHRLMIPIISVCRCKPNSTFTHVWPKT